ncbi:hypothetical protein [Pedobacter sp. JCM 36344]|uniref:hypothetical protein n=1 Tax=Pedobacter sp. JCM 36344 TaxID=3374280 RepID=UPI00397D2522
MIKTSTSTNQLNYERSMMESAIERSDLAFYQTLKPQLDALIRNPSEETISKILAYSKKK